MPTITREALAAAAAIPQGLPQESVPFAPLGGDVLVRGLWLEDRFVFDAWLATVAAPPVAGQSAEGQAAVVVPPSADSLRAAGATAIQKLLSLSVIDETTGQPLLTFEEWRAVAARHYDDVIVLGGVAQRLAGLAQPESVAKN